MIFFFFQLIKNNKIPCPSQRRNFNNWESGMGPCVGLKKDIVFKDVSFDACDEYGCVSVAEGPD